MTTTPPAPPTRLPRYGIRDDEMTKPCVVLVDWTNEEVTVNSEPSSETLELLPDADVHAVIDDEELEQNPDDVFAPRWRGVGRRPGAVALAVVLGLCLAIGLVALLNPAEAQTAASGVALR